MAPQNLFRKNNLFKRAPESLSFAERQKCNERVEKCNEYAGRNYVAEK
jgi:hypothetical protein